MDIANIYAETGDKRRDEINVVKTWLVGGTDGQTYSLDSLIDIDCDKIDPSKWDTCGCSYESQFDSIVGFSHDYKVDDPSLEETAVKILDGLKALARDIENNPQDYFEPVRTSGVRCLAFQGITCDYAASYGNGIDVCTNCGDCPFKEKEGTAE